MITVTITDSCRRQLMGWIIREVDHLRSIKAMAKDILIPQHTQLLLDAETDLELAVRLKQDFHGDGLINISTEDAETLLEIAKSNRYEDKAELWNEVKNVLTKVL